MGQNATCLLELLSRDGAAAISIEPAEKVAAGLSSEAFRSQVPGSFGLTGIQAACACGTRPPCLEYHVRCGQPYLQSTWAATR